MKIILSGVAMLAAICSFAPASTALPQAPQTAEAPQGKKGADDPDKVTCKRMELKKKLPSAVIKKERICHTRAEWDELLRVNEEMMKRYRDEFRKGSPPN
jgi:hypothetical protein